MPVVSTIFLVFKRQFLVVAVLEIGMIANTKALENLRVGFLASRADSAAAAPVQVLLLPEFDASHSFFVSCF